MSKRVTRISFVLERFLSHRLPMGTSRVEPSEPEAARQSDERCRLIRLPPLSMQVYRYALLLSFYHGCQANRPSAGVVSPLLESCMARIISSRTPKRIRMRIQAG